MGGTNDIGMLQDSGFALRMSKDFSIRVLLLELEQCFFGEASVHMASAIPQLHLSARHAVDIAAKVLVWTKENGLIFRQLLHDLQGVATGHYHIGECLYSSTGIDIRHDHVSGVLCLPCCQICCLTTICQRATCLWSWDKHFLVRTKDFGCLCHEVYTAHHDDVGIRLGCHLSQSQRVAYEVSHILNLRALVVVRHDDGVLLFAQCAYLFR